MGALRTNWPSVRVENPGPCAPIATGVANMVSGSAVRVSFTASDVIAISAILATVAIAWIAHLDRLGDREHARRLAREAHGHERRSAAYQDMLAMVLRIRDGVRQTMPMWERVPPPPRIEPPTPDEQRQVAATVGLYGTPAIAKGLDDAILSANVFYIAADYLSDLRASRSPSQTADELPKARTDVDAKREAFYANVEALTVAARQDLA